MFAIALATSGAAFAMLVVALAGSGAVLAMRDTALGASRGSLVEDRLGSEEEVRLRDWGVAARA